MSFLSARSPRYTLAALMLSCVPLTATAQNSAPPASTPPATSGAKTPAQGAPSPPAMTPEVTKAVMQFQAASDFQKKNRLPEAIAAYQEFLRLGTLAKMDEKAMLPAYDNLYRLYQARSDAKGMEEALKHIGQILPDNPGVFVEYAMLYLSEQRMEGAKKYADKALQLNPPPPLAAQAHFVRGAVAYSRKQWNVAEIEYGMAIKLAPDNPQAQYNLVMTLHEEKKSAQAITTAEKLLKLQPKMTPAWMLLASLKEQNKNLVGAIKAYAEVLKYEPTNKGALYNRASLYQQIGKVNEAISAYAAYLNVAPKDFGAHYNLGLLYQGIHNLAAARKHFALAAELKPKDARAIYQVALSERDQGFLIVDKPKRDAMLAQAITHFKQALALDPKDVGMENQLGALYQHDGRFEDALALYRARQQQDPDNPEPYQRLTNVFIALRRVDDAIAEWRKFRSRKPNSPISYAEIARLLEAQGKWKEAAGEYIEQVKLDPKDGAAKLALARDYQQLKQPQDAETQYKAILDQDVTAQDVGDKERVYVSASRRGWRNAAWRGLSELSAANGKFEEAITYLRNVQQEDTREARIDQKAPDGQTYLDIAGLYERNKQPELARKELKTLTEVRPDDGKAFAALADFEERQGKIEEAVFNLNRAEERTSDPIAYGLQAAAVYQRHTLWDKAIGEFTRLTAKYPHEPRLLTPMAELLGQIGNDTKALSLYDVLLKANPNDLKLLDKKAVVLTRLKRYAEARTLREKLVDKSPDDYQAYANLAYLYTQEGKPEIYRQWLTARVEKDPTFQPAMAALVDAYTQQKQEEAGWKTLQGIVQKHRDDIVVEEAYIDVLAKHDRLPEAIERRREIARSSPADLDAHLKLADLLTSHAETLEANKVFREFADRASVPLQTRTRARRVLAQRLEAQGDIPEAITQWQEIIKAEPQDLPSYLTLGRLLSQANRDKEAVALYSERAKQDRVPAFWRAHFLTLLGSISEKQGNKAEAAGHYQEALRLDPKNQEAGTALKRLASNK